jgi:hypothetical protein
MGPAGLILLIHLSGDPIHLGIVKIQGMFSHKVLGHKDVIIDKNNDIAFSFP